MRKNIIKAKTGLYKVEDLVKQLLEQYKEARDNDYYLTFRVIEKMTPEDLDKPYREILLKPTREISFKSIERARRKVQSKYPELKASKKVQEARDEYETAFIGYAIEGNHIPRIDYNIGE